MRVRARPLGWDEVLTPAQSHDMDPYDGPTEPVEGELTVRTVVAEEPYGTMTIYHVGGVSVDPKTIEYL